MTTTRLQYRGYIGRAIGRRYYLAGTTSGTSTTDKILDPTRTEFAAEWDGAEFYCASATAPKTAIVRGTSAASANGFIYLDTALGSAPATGSAYEMFKGWTKQDYDDAIDFAHAESYPHLYLPLDDTATVTLATSARRYALTESWKEITKVRKAVANSSPTSYVDLIEDYDYRIWQGTAGLVLEMQYTPTEAVGLHFLGKKVASIASADSDISLLPWQVVVPGALKYLGMKGINADEAAQMTAELQQKIQRADAEFDTAKRRYAMRSGPRRAKIPTIGVINDGSSVSGWSA